MSVNDEHTHVARAVLEVVFDLHPDHLTIPELALKLSADPGDRLEGETIAHAIRDLRGSGLLRHVGDVVVPTHAALRATALLLSL